MWLRDHIVFIEGYSWTFEKTRREEFITELWRGRYLSTFRQRLYRKQMKPKDRY